MPKGPEILKTLWEEKFAPLVDDLTAQIDAGIDTVTKDTIGSTIAIPLNVATGVSLPKQVKEQVAKRFVEAGWAKCSIVKKKESEETVAELTFPAE